MYFYKIFSFIEQNRMESYMQQRANFSKKIYVFFDISEHKNMYDVKGNSNKKTRFEILKF